MKANILTLLLCVFAMTSPAEDTSGRIRIVTLDPGHFHAALVQKAMPPNIDPVVHVYAPDGDDLRLHLGRVAAYNARANEPTKWNEKVYSGAGYFERMLEEKAGNLVVLSGNNRKKTEYILKSLDAGFNVLADKPMIIDNAEFDALKRAFAVAERKHLLLYDIMTERYEITTRLQRELSRMPDVFGTLDTGTEQDPAVVMKSVHHVSKTVSGAVLTRPAWFFDVAQQGEGIADVMTHLVDLVQWECFPDEAIDYTKDISVDKARHWTMGMTVKEFSAVTKAQAVPEFLKQSIGRDSSLHFYFNGEIDYTIRGVHARTTALWEYTAPAGSGDTHYSLLRGTKSRLVIRQGAGEKFKPTLFIEPVGTGTIDGQRLTACIESLQKTYPGIALKPTKDGWEVVVPGGLQEGHEEHFARVMTTVGEFYRHTPLPAWEVPNMLAKYYTTARALELAKADAAVRPGSYPWDSLAFVRPHRSGAGWIMNGSTTPFAHLDIRAVVLPQGEKVEKSSAAGAPEELLIVKTGTVKVVVEKREKILGSGSIILIMPGDLYRIENAGIEQASFYSIAYRSRETVNEMRGQQTGGSMTVDWNAIPFSPHDKGGVRQFFSRATAMTKRLDMHVKTLNPEIKSHEPHTHGAEEIVLMVHGTTEMQIDGNVYPGTEGDIYFLPCNIPHAIRNTGKVPCMYYAIQWE